MTRVFLIKFIIFFIYISMTLLVSLIVVRNIYVLIHTNFGVSFYIGFEDLGLILIPSLVISIFISCVTLYNRR